ncbi:molecular chaperone DnaJ [Pseudohongiella sp.]|uniref:J domain-containing protein n=1 Tax=marine sediment metagenome TaxID=412755 RepID=A0A0F9VZN1_9ZZZZ|nr:molecular chaperone DnaJ [Pseudohongiella sp.]HDZ10356.1 molecular chaperone DnaJ [Pseudohongiella sp.]HEA62021.1 molecular chaperone DnaJ [Pseudohongiella sp.]
MIILRLLAPLVLAWLAYWGLRRLSQRYSLTARQFKWLVGLAAALLVIMVLIVMGRLPVQALAAPFLFLLTFLLRNGHWLMRILPMLRPKYQSQSSSPRGDSAGPGVSAINTRWLAMELTHSTGAMDGEVLAGRFAGKQLSTLALEDLLSLAGECRQDADSIQLLEAYLDRMFPDWQAHADADSSEQSRPASSDSMMTEPLALEILGLDSGASREAITTAHRRLMQKMHPDRGGSDYLAQRINQARDFLLRKA